MNFLLDACEGTWQDYLRKKGERVRRKDADENKSKLFWEIVSFARNWSLSVVFRSLNGKKGESYTKRCNRNISVDLRSQKSILKDGEVCPKEEKAVY